MLQPSFDAKKIGNGICIFSSDLLALTLSFFIGILGLRYYGSYIERPENWSIWFSETGLPQLYSYLFFVFMSLLSFWFSGHYNKRLPFWDELLAIFKNVCFISLMHGALVLVAKWPFSRFLWLNSWGFALLFIPLLRHLTKTALKEFGFWQIKTVIVGSGKNAIAAYEALISEPSLGFVITHFLGFQSQEQLPASFQLTSKENLMLDLQKINYPHVIVALEQNEFSEYQDLINSMIIKYPSFSLIPDIGGLPLLGMELNHFFSHEVLLLNVRNNLANPFARFTKRILDIVFSLLLLIGLTPLFIYIAFHIKKTKGPAIFSHLRIGRNGKKFKCYKFRTMIQDAEKVLQDILQKDPAAKAMWDKEFKLKDDPRVTPIGQLLRKTSLDELPQLWNVLKGEMSLVGPRPIVEAELEKYGYKSSYYLATRPGLTGLWQVSGRNDVSYEIRTNLDAWYVKNWNVWYDIAILFKTVNVVVQKKGAY